MHLCKFQGMQFQLICQDFKLGWVVLEVLDLAKSAVFLDILLIISDQFGNVLDLYLVLEVIADVLTHVVGRLESIEQPHRVILYGLICLLKANLFEVSLHVLVG